MQREQRREQEAPAVEFIRPQDEQRPNKTETQPRRTNEIPQSEQSPRSLEKKDLVLVALEEALADELASVYKALPAERQLTFKEQGERLAIEVRQMMATKKWQPHKILKMLTAWLNLIPQVNVYFLRQIAKIKLDALTDIYEAQL